MCLPDQVPAGTKAMMCQVGFGGTNPLTGDLYAVYEAIGGGYGVYLGVDSDLNEETAGALLDLSLGYRF